MFLQLAMTLLSKGPAIQSLALAAVKSGADANDIQEIASLGNYGRNSNHIAGQLTHKYCKDDTLAIPMPYFFEAPVMKKGSDSTYLGMAQLAVFLPHEWFCWMEGHGHVSGASEMEDFWAAHLDSDPKLTHNPVMAEGKEKFLPLALHGDGGQFQRWDSINIVSFRSLLSAGNVGTTQMLLAAIPKSCISKSEVPEQDTMSCVWKVLVWSFEHCFFGKFPERNHEGKKWTSADKQRQDKAGLPLQTSHTKACLFAVSADGEYLQNEFRLAGASRNKMCFNCDADKDSLPYNDFRVSAGWKKTIKKHEGATPTTHLIKKIPGFNGHSFHYDTLHNLEEGVASHALANTMFDLCLKSEGLGGTQDQNVVSLYKKVLQQYHEQGIIASDRIRRLGMSNFCQPKSKYDHFPELTGYKARHIRYLVPVIMEIAKEFKKDDDEYSQHRFQCLFHLNGMYQCIDSSGMHMDANTWKLFKHHTDRTLLHYSRLSKITMQDGWLQWSTVPKFHLVAHMPDQAKYLNPRFVSTYAGETMIGHMSRCAHSCLNGTPAHLVPEKVLWRFRLGFHLKFLHGSGEVPTSSDEE